MLALAEPVRTFADSWPVTLKVAGRVTPCKVRSPANRKLSCLPELYASGSALLATRHEGGERIFVCLEGISANVHVTVRRAAVKRS